MSEFFFVLIGAALVNHLILSLPAPTGVQRSARLRLVGPASALLILLATPLSWLLHRLLLNLDLDYLHLLLSLPLLAALAWVCLAVIARWQRPEEPVNGLLPLLLGNGAGLGIMLTSTPLASFALALALGVAGGLGFWLVMQLLADLLERAAQGDVPAPFRGAPLLLVCAGLMGLAFLGLNGLGAT